MTQKYEIEGLPEGFELKHISIKMMPESWLEVDKRSPNYNPMIDRIRAQAEVILIKNKETT